MIVRMRYLRMLSNALAGGVLLALSTGNTGLSIAAVQQRGGGFVLAPGRHTVTFRHPRLGERSVDCFVTLQEPLRLSADLRK